MTDMATTSPINTVSHTALLMNNNAVCGTVLFLAAGLCACAGRPIEAKEASEPRRTATESALDQEPQRNARMDSVSALERSLTVELRLTDAEGAPFTGAVVARAERHSDAIPQEPLVPAWPEPYVATATIEGGVGALVFELTELDAAVLGEYGGFDLTISAELAEGPYPWEPGIHVDPGAGAAAFFEDLEIDDRRGAAEGLVTRIDTSLAPPPRYGTVRFTRPLEGGERLLAGVVTPTRETRFKTRLWSRMEADMVDLPEGATEIPVYSWSRAHAQAIEVYDVEWDLVEPTSILRARGTLEIER